MNIYDTANKLAKEIRASKEYKNYKQLKKSIELNEEQKRKVEDFEKLRYKIQVKEMQGQGSNETERELLQEKYVELLKDDEVKKYFEAEIKFNVMIADVNKIIAEAVKDVL